MTTMTKMKMRTMKAGIFSSSVSRPSQLRAGQHKEQNVSSIEEMPGPGQQRRRGSEERNFIDNSVQELLNLNVNDFTFGTQLMNDPLAVMDSLDNQYV